MVSGKWSRLVITGLFCFCARACMDEQTVATFKTQPNDDPKLSGIVEVLELSPRFTLLEAQTIRDAANDWTNTTNGIATIFVDDNRPLVRKDGWKYRIVFVRPIDEKEPMLFYIDGLVNGNIVGLTDIFGYLTARPTIYLVRDRIYSIEEYGSVVRHELGHSIGLEHDSSPDALMYPYTNEDSKCITTVDMDQFCGIYECPKDLPQLNGCNSDLVCR